MAEDERLVTARLVRTREPWHDSDGDEDEDEGKRRRDDADKRKREDHEKKMKKLRDPELRFTDGNPYSEDDMIKEREDALRAGGVEWENYKASIQTKRENYIKDYQLKTGEMNILQQLGASLMRWFLGDHKFSLETDNDDVLVWATLDGIVHYPASVRAIKQKLQSVETQTDMDTIGGNKTKRRHRRKSVRHRRKSVRYRKNQ
jgi:hypothetical protein